MMMVRARSFLPFFVFPFSFFLLQGCSSGPAKLTLHPEQGNVAFAKTFTEAYCGREADGSYACVLVADDAPAVQTPESGPLRQVVHIKVLWRPMNGIRDSVASNAAIDWYVISTTPQGHDDLLVYQGAGFVTFEPDGKVAKVEIRSADLKPALAKGNLKDPIGRTSITGTFVASANRQKFKDVLNSTRQHVATVASGG